MLYAELVENNRPTEFTGDGTVSKEVLWAASCEY